MAAVVAQNCIFIPNDRLALVLPVNVMWGTGSRSKEGSYLVEGVEQFRDQRAPRTGRTQGIHQAEMLQVADEMARPLRGEGEGVAPEVPLEGDDGDGAHADHDHGQSRFPPGQPRVEEPQARYHDHHHGRGHDDVGLVSGRVPLIEVLFGCRDVGLAMMLM